MRYTEDYEQQRGKGSFPAMITPAYQIAKRANELASDVSAPSNAVVFGEEAGSDPGLGNLTSYLLLLAPWIEEVAFLPCFQSVYHDLATFMSKTHSLDPSRKRAFHKTSVTFVASGHRRLKLLGRSFPFKQVRYHQQYHREMKGMAGPATGAEGTLTKEYVDQYSQVGDNMTSGTRSFSIAISQFGSP